MSDKTKEIVAELEYTKENGDNIHSDLDFDFEMKEEIRKPLHDCLDEWLDKSNGNGGFYLRNANHHFEDYFELLEKPKRKPLSDGSLPMTDEELREFNKIVADFIKRFFQITYQNRVKIYEDKVCLVFKHDYTRDEHLIFVSELKAILYLATLFDLTGEK